MRKNVSAPAVPEPVKSAFYEGREFSSGDFSISPDFEDFSMALSFKGKAIAKNLNGIVHFSLWGNVSDTVVIGILNELVAPAKISSMNGEAFLSKWRVATLLSPDGWHSELESDKK